VSWGLLSLILEFIMLVRLIDGRVVVVVDYELLTLWSIGASVALVVNILS
jgi:hypothetical protein